MVDEIIKENQAGKNMPWKPEEFSRSINEVSKPIVGNQALYSPPGLGSRLTGSWGAGAESVAEDIVGGIKTAGGAIASGAQAVGGVIAEGAPIPLMTRGVQAIGRAVEPGLEKLAAGPSVQGTWTERGEYIPPERTSPGPDFGLAGTETREGSGVVSTASTRPTGGQPTGVINEPGLGGAGPAESAPVGMRTSIYNEAPEAPMGSFSGGVVPSGYSGGGGGGGYGGFVDKEMARLEKDRAEYDKYTKDKEDKELLGIGSAGEERIKNRMKSLAPYLEGVSKGRKAKIFAGVLEQSMKEESEGRKALYTTRASGEAATTVAGIKAGATREAAYAKAQTEAAKLGIDIRKLGIEEQKLGLEAGKAGATIKESMARIQNMMHGQGVAEMKLALEGAKDSADRRKIEMEFANKYLTTSYTEGLKNLREEFRMNPNAPEFQKRAQALYNDFSQGSQVLEILNPREGQVWGKNIRKGNKWVPITAEEQQKMKSQQQEVVPTE